MESPRLDTCAREIARAIDDVLGDDAWLDALADSDFEHGARDARTHDEQNADARTHDEQNADARTHDQQNADARTRGEQRQDHADNDVDPVAHDAHAIDDVDGVDFEHSVGVVFDALPGADLERDVVDALPSDVFADSLGLLVHAHPDDRVSNEFADDGDIMVDAPSDSDFEHDVVIDALASNDLEHNVVIDVVNDDYVIEVVNSASTGGHPIVDNSAPIVTRADADNSVPIVTRADADNSAGRAAGDTDDHSDDNPAAAALLARSRADTTLCDRPEPIALAAEPSVVLAPATESRLSTELEPTGESRAYDVWYAKYLANDLPKPLPRSRAPRASATMSKPRQR